MDTISVTEYNLLVTDQWNIRKHIHSFDTSNRRITFRTRHYQRDRTFYRVSDQESMTFVHAWTFQIGK